MSDLFDQMKDIAGLQEFMSLPVPMESRQTPMDDEPGLSMVPTAQRVQAVLAKIYGAEWYSAVVFSYPLPDGGCSHVAMSQHMRGVAMKMVYESSNDVLTLCAAFPPENVEMQADGAIALAQDIDQALTEVHEQQCLLKILPALIEASQIVQDAEISKKRKRRIRRELAHASQHLSDISESMQTGY